MQLFLITSSLNPIASNVKYNVPRSVFTMEERFIQTVHTITSIRDKVPNSYCILLETTNVPENYRKTIEETVDKYIDFSTSQFAKTFTESKEKGMGELFTLEKGLLHILSNNITFERLYKISGRYYLNDKFDLKSISSNKCTFVKFENKSDSNIKDYWYGTMLYSIDWNHRWEYLEALNNSLIAMIINGVVDIEHGMYSCIPPTSVEIIKTIGCQGQMSVNGQYAYH